MKAEFSNDGTIMVKAENLTEYLALRKIFPIGHHKKAWLECSHGCVMGYQSSTMNYTMHIHPISPL